MASYVVGRGRNNRELVHRNGAATLVTDALRSRISRYGNLEHVFRRWTKTTAREFRLLERSATHNGALSAILAPHSSPALATPRTTSAVGLAESNPLPSGCSLNERGMLGDTAC